MWQRGRAWWHYMYHQRRIMQPYSDIILIFVASYILLNEGMNAQINIYYSVHRSNWLIELLSWEYGLLSICSRFVNVHFFSRQCHPSQHNFNLSLRTEMSVCFFLCFWARRPKGFRQTCFPICRNCFFGRKNPLLSGADWDHSAYMQNKFNKFLVSIFFFVRSFTWSSLARAHLCMGTSTYDWHKAFVLFSEIEEKEKPKHTYARLKYSISGAFNGILWQVWYLNIYVQK